MNETNKLPLEIIHKIIEQFVNQLHRQVGFNSSIVSERHLTDSSYAELIKLRLISKNWAKAVIPFYFQTISIKDSKYAKVLLDNWTDDLYLPYPDCPVKTLTIKNLWYSDQEEYGENPADITPPVSMSQLTRLIKLLGANLRTLDLTFLRSRGVSPELIEAIKTIKDLKSLSISNGHSQSKSGIYDSNSISDLFSAIPNLECLSYPDSSLDCSNVGPKALSNLRSLSFTYTGCMPEDEEDEEEEEKPVEFNLTQNSTNTLKIIELFSSTEDNEGLGKVFEPIKNTLEGLFTLSFCNQLLDDVTDLRFPKLRVLRTRDAPDEDMSDISWLEARMLRNVRTIVSDLDSSEDYWDWILSSVGKDGFKMIPKFKLILFTRDQRNQNQVIRPELVKGFESHGIQCQVTNELTCDEIMELDQRVNGPME